MNMCILLNISKSSCNKSLNHFQFIFQSKMNQWTDITISFFHHVTHLFLGQRIDVPSKKSCGNDTDNKNYDDSRYLCVREKPTIASFTLDVIASHKFHGSATKLWHNLSYKKYLRSIGINSRKKKIRRAHIEKI